MLEFESITYNSINRIESMLEDYVTEEQLEDINTSIEWLLVDESFMEECYRYHNWLEDFSNYEKSCETEGIDKETLFYCFDHCKNDYDYGIYEEQRLYEQEHELLEAKGFFNANRY